MSVILDALKRAEQERKKASEKVHQGFGTAEPKKRRIYLIALGGAACLAIVLLVVPFLFKSKPVQPLTAAAVATPPVTSPVNSPTPVAPAPVNSLAPVAPAPAVNLEKVNVTASPEKKPSPAASVKKGSEKPEAVTVKERRWPPEKGLEEQGDKAQKRLEAKQFEKPQGPLIAKRSEMPLPKKQSRPEGAQRESHEQPEVSVVENRIVIKPVDDGRITQLYNLAVRETEKGNVEEAVKLYKNVLAERPGHAEVLNNLGVLAMKEGHNREAIAYFRTCLLSRGDYEKAYNNLGLVLLKEGEKVQAEEAFRKSIEIDKSRIEPYLNLISLLRSEKRFEEALKVLETALAGGTREPTVYLSYALIKDEMHDYREAVKFYRQYLNSGGRRDERVLERLKFLEENQSAKGR
jgi:Flp pilus assembly protein TadD